MNCAPRLGGQIIVALGVYEVGDTLPFLYLILPLLYLLFFFLGLPTEHWRQEKELWRRSYRKCRSIAPSRRASELFLVICLGCRGSGDPRTWHACAGQQRLLICVSGTGTFSHAFFFLLLSRFVGVRTHL